MPETMLLKAPFPWFGGKSRVAADVWDRFGDCPNYVEPFAGSMAVLLARPHAGGTETVNDVNAFLSNFWRALRTDPDGLAALVDWPVNEADLEARHLWLVNSTREIRDKVKADPDFYDVKVAAWWVWGLCSWIGSGWCAGAERGHGRPSHQLPHVGNAGMGVHRKLPHVGDAGRGVHRKLPHVGDAGRDRLEWLVAEFTAISSRLRHVRVACGDWKRVLGPSTTERHGVTAIFLDPPYTAKNDRMGDVYGSTADDCASEAAEWAFENGRNPLLRIALCGYDGDYALPDGWVTHRWKARGGYGSQGDGSGRENAERECVFFSPHCLRMERFAQIDMLAYGIGF